MNFSSDAVDAKSRETLKISSGKLNFRFRRRAIPGTLRQKGEAQTRATTTRGLLFDMVEREVPKKFRGRFAESCSQPHLLFSSGRMACSRSHCLTMDLKSMLDEMSPVGSQPSRVAGSRGAERSYPMHWRQFNQLDTRHGDYMHLGRGAT